MRLALPPSPARAAVPALLRPRASAGTARAAALERLAADVAALALIAGLALWVNLHVVPYGLDTLDEGFEYQLASRILHGQVPYRDFFTVVTPLGFYLQALLIAVFGPGLLVGRIAVAVVGAGIAMAIYGAGSQVAARPLALAAALAWIPWGIPYWAQPNYSWDVNLAALLAAWVALRAGAGRARWWTPGLLAALTVLTKQNVGLVAAVALAGYAAWRGGWPGLRGYTLGLALPLAAFLAYLAGEHALGAFWYQTVWFAAHVFPGRTAAGIPYPTLRSVAQALRGHGGGLQPLLTYMPQALLCVGALLVEGGLLARRPWCPEGALVWGLVLAGLVIAYPRSDFVHIDYAFPLTFLGLGWVLWRLCLGQRWALPLPLLGLLTLTLLAWPWGVARSGAGNVPLPGPYSRGIRVDRGTAATIGTVVAAIDAAGPPGSPVLVLPYANMLYYLADRPNPTPYDLDITLNVPPGGNAEIAAAMGATHCPVFYQPNAGISLPFQAYGAPVLAELHSHYQLVATPGGFQEWLWSA